MDLLDFLWWMFLWTRFKPTAAVFPKHVSDVTFRMAKEYLKEYHYTVVDIHNTQDSNPAYEIVHKDKSSKFTKSLMEFQSLWHLNVTGVLDTETKKLMNYSRCGVEDVTSSADLTRKKRYLVQGSRWYKKSLTYKIDPYPKQAGGLNAREVDDIISKAFWIWENATQLTFTKIDKSSKDKNVDLFISFLRFYHGDEYPFDGFGGKLAHAFFPQYEGDVHFDDNEVWTKKSKKGTNLFQVAVHEIGHSLGLGHSFNRDALMAPFYTGYTPNLKLHPDDIAGIQHLYGKPIHRKNKQKQSQSKTFNDNSKKVVKTPKCEDINFDAITAHKEGEDIKTYAFFGEYYAEITEHGIALGYPRKIEKDWVGLPSHLDAALFWEPQYEETIKQKSKPKFELVKKEIFKSRTYFFKGDFYWKFEDKKLSIDGYPRLISKWFRGVPNNVDASFVWGRNGMTYFIKGEWYYRYSPGKGVDYGYPRPMFLWKNLPKTGITAAFQWPINKKTYFFDKKQYYRFNDYQFKVESNYPKSVSTWWLNCRGQRLTEGNLADSSSVSENQTSHQTPTTAHQKSQLSHSCAVCGISNACIFLVIVQTFLIYDIWAKTMLS